MEFRGIQLRSISRQVFQISTPEMALEIKNHTFEIATSPRGQSGKKWWCNCVHITLKKKTRLDAFSRVYVEFCALQHEQKC